MIYLQKGKKNKVCVTLSESATLENPFFLFVFTREIDSDPNPIFWQPEELSSFTSRFNLFELNEPDFNFASGQYKYEVYESEVQTTNISETTGTPIEIGKMVVELKNETTSIYD